MVAPSRDAHSFRCGDQKRPGFDRHATVPIEPAAGHAPVPDVAAHSRVALALNTPGRLDSSSHGG